MSLHPVSAERILASHVLQETLLSRSTSQEMAEPPMRVMMAPWRDRHSSMVTVLVGEGVEASCGP